MHTIFTIFLLILSAFVLGFLATIILPNTGLIGNIIGGEPGKRSKFRLQVGVIIASIFQTYFYLCYIAFMVSLTKSRLEVGAISNSIVWIFSFLCSLVPLWWGAVLFKVHHDDKQTGYANTTVEATYLTGFLAFIGFFVFVFVADAMKLLWDWVPYVE